VTMDIDRGGFEEQSSLFVGALSIRPFELKTGDRLAEVMESGDRGEPAPDSLWRQAEHASGPDLCSWRLAIEDGFDDGCYIQHVRQQSMAGWIAALGP